MEFCFCVVAENNDKRNRETQSKGPPLPHTATYYDVFPERPNHLLYQTWSQREGKHPSA